MKPTTKRIAWVAGILAVSIAAGSWGYRQAMFAGLIRINEYDIRSEGILQVGELAPDLELADVDGGMTKLSQLWAAKPLVLVFGSYT